MTLKDIFSIFLITFLFFTAASGRSATTVPEADKEFVYAAAQANMAEVKLGMLAKEKAAAASVKSFADRLVTDHSTSLAHLQKIAEDKGLALPDDISGEQHSHYEMLSKLSGQAFDKEFSKHMLAGHQKVIGKFETQEQSGQDDEIKKYAHATLPTLRQHLRIAESLKP